MARTRGYKEASAQLYGMLYRDQAEWSSSASLSARKRLAALTGREFRSFADLQQWWLDTNDYLVWSDTQKHLVVDEAAKSAKKPIVPLHPLEEISAERYWFSEGMGWIKDAKDQGPDLLAKVWTGDHEIQIRISQSSLRDRVSKEQGYREAVKTIIEDRLKLRELDETGARELIQRLQAITTERFEDRQAWIGWWNANMHNLILSADGRRLTVGARSR